MEIAEVLKKTIFDMVSMDDPMKLYIQFRGAEPNSEAMLKRKGLI